MIYIEYLRNAFRTQFRYRLNWIMKLLGNFIIIFFQICLWSALLTSKENITNMEYMLGYILLSTMMQSLISSGTVGIVNGKIKTGQIAMDLIKPIRFKWFIFFELLGNQLFYFLFTYVPVTIVITILYKCYNFWLNIDIFFIISVCLGVYLNFSITYCLGLSGFWGTQTWVLGRFYDDISKVFSGKFIPVWMLPALLLKINIALPFQYTIYAPITMMINSLAIYDKISMIVIQIIWSLVFTGLGMILERKGKKKLQVQGG